MTNLEYLISKLGNTVFSSRICSADINRDTSFEFLDDQKELLTNIIYIVSASTAAKKLSGCTVIPGCILFIAGAKEDFTEPVPEDISLVVCSYPQGKLFNLCSHTLKNLFSLRTQVNSSSHDYIQDQAAELWKQIRSRCLTEEDEIRSEWKAILSDTVKDYFRISVISPDNRYSTPLYAGAITELKSIIGNGIIFPIGTYNDEFVIIQFFDEQPFYDFANRKEADEILKKYNMHMTIGNGTSSYAEMNTVFRLYYRANYLAHQLQIQSYTHVYYYENYATFDIIDLSAQRFTELFGNSNIIYLIDPAVMHIMRYDKKHNTNLSEILFTYLIHNKDVKATAERLYMHRNTVTKKLNQIKEICPINFDSGYGNQRIIFSCQLVSYYEKVLKLSFKTD